jgi:multiple antibiotic resistance protein
MSVLSTAFLLVLVMDPVGNMMTFLAVLKNVEHKRKRAIIIRELFVALAVLILFLFLGRFVLEFLHINEAALSISGGIILFLIALKMIFPNEKGIFGGTTHGEPFIVPLAIPLIAGPSTLATILLFVSKEPGKWIEQLAAITLAWLVSGVILSFSTNLAKILGDRSLTACQHLMGMILAAISVQMFMGGVKIFFNL